MNTASPSINRNQLFIASCISLVTTSMVFAIRGAIQGDMGADFHLTNELMGQMWGPAFWGFTIAIFICGFIVDIIGMRATHALSSIGYLAGLALVFLAPKPELADGEVVSGVFATSGTSMVFFGFLLMGLSQGVVEGVINPLVASMYTDKKAKMLNILHAWWPGGLIIGGLTAYFLAKNSVSWELTLGTLAVPAVLALILVAINKYPQSEAKASNISVGEQLKHSLGSPFFLLMFGLMWITASSELAPDQWFPKVMGEITGMDEGGILFLVYTAGLMFVVRSFFAGLVHKFNPFLVLSASSILCAGGLFWLGSLSVGSTAVIAFVAATLFGIGKTFYWPTMLGIVSERCPKGGALAMNLMGGAGMLAVGLALPQIGKLMDKYDAGTAMRVFAALPGFLIVAFAIIGLIFKAKGGYKALALEGESQGEAQQHADEATAAAPGSDL